MTATGTVPPQAYTREVLAKAYEWLTTQPPAVRERVTSADALVGLYLQARRRMQSATTESASGRLEWETTTSTASVEAFKADLRSLAEGLKQFDDPLAPPQGTFTGTVAPATSPPPVMGYATEPTSHPLAMPPTLSNPSVTQAHTFSPQAPSPAQPRSAPTPPPTAQALPSAANGSFFVMDPRTQDYVREVQSRLNLSSEADAARALIALGYERMRSLFSHS